jgi:peroxiredoxin
MALIEGSTKTAAASGRRHWHPGEPVPWFTAPTLQGNEKFVFDSVAGRYVLLLFAGSMTTPAMGQALLHMRGCRDLLDDRRACFFGITIDPEDEKAGRIAKIMPGLRWFLDYDSRVSTLFGATDGTGGYTPFWMLVDPMLRVVGTAPLLAPETLFTTFRQQVEAATAGLPAPVAVLPRIFEPELCRELIALYETRGGFESWFMRDVEGVTTELVDHGFKRRFDHLIEDGHLQDRLSRQLRQTLFPMVQRIFQFEATHIERHVVACYDGDGDGGFFMPHRDDITAGTAHRRFACTINLNADDYEGGDLFFPEFGARTYRAPTGGAVVFSCSLLHGAQPVTRGKRYAYLPFLYDDAAARIREANLSKLAPENGGAAPASEG